ncbi:unnamed protein product [Pieris macdunnoughi]|uniref:Uncharacterized protein n=1 Tax=Pieris macdunnoughi TaxID=345717 RepID=A0A821XQI2_9NEOP|nr:unnamed protein product [Pieris macdunnoughi]
MVGNHFASISPEVNPSEVWRTIRRFRSAYNNSPSSKLSLTLADQFMDLLAPRLYRNRDFPQYLFLLTFPTT